MDADRFISYEYKELYVSEETASFYLDCYENFGWRQDEKFPPQRSGGRILLKLKRNRKIANKAELTRLQRHFEGDMEEITILENSKTREALAVTIFTAMMGTACMTGSVFAVTASPPQIGFSVFLAIPAFAGWISPYFIYRELKERKTRQVTSYIEAKYDEIYEICEKGHLLL